MENKLGIVVFANDSGLGAQTRRLTYALRPNRILAIDSSKFSKVKKQNFDWYANFSGYKVGGFPTDREVNVFLKGLTHVLVCENPLNFNLLTEAKKLGIKVYIQSNYEFCDHLDKDITLPHKFLMPSYWKVKEMKKRFGDDLVQYLPPPIDPREFSKARSKNFNREGRRKYLHIIGNLAVNDRNGTLDLFDSLKYTDSVFDLVIKSQHRLPDEYIFRDSRVSYLIGNEPDQRKLYEGFDALILPRRYGGLSLTTNEALMSGLPVIMPDISPNNKLLPSHWLVEASKKMQFKTRTMIDVYQTDAKKLAEKIDWLGRSVIEHEKIIAFGLGHDNFSETSLIPEYNNLWT